MHAPSSTTTPALHSNTGPSLTPYSPPPVSHRQHAEFPGPGPLSGISEAKWAREVKLASKVEGVKAEKSWLLSTAVSILVVLRSDILTRAAVLAEMKSSELSTALIVRVLVRNVRKCFEGVGF